METSPDQLTLIAADSSGEVGKSWIFFFFLPPLSPDGADKRHQVLCKHTIWGFEQELRDGQGRDRSRQRKEQSEVLIEGELVPPSPNCF